MPRSREQIRIHPGGYGASRWRWQRQEWLWYVLPRLLASCLDPVFCTGAVSCPAGFLGCLSDLKLASVIFSKEPWPVQPSVRGAPVRGLFVWDVAQRGVVKNANTCVLPLRFRCSQSWGICFGWFFKLEVTVLALPHRLSRAQRQRFFLENVHTQIH